MGLETKKVDAQGRIVLPLDWRESDLKDANEVIIIREKGYLKIIPKTRVDLTQFFDSIDFHDDIFEENPNWTEVEKHLARKRMDKNQ